MQLLEKKQVSMSKQDKMIWLNSKLPENFLHDYLSTAQHLNKSDYLNFNSLPKL